MITYGELTNRIKRLVEDVSEETPKYTTELYVDAIQAAFKAIQPWVPKTAIASLTLNDTVSLTLPDDFYDIQAVVVNSTGEILPRTELVPGKFTGTNTQGTNAWVLYASGKITFQKAPDGNIDLYYLADWVVPTITTAVNEEIEPPDHAITGISFYAAGQVMLPTGLGITEIRQFATKVDSGNPEHNPVRQAVDYLMKLFLNEMSRMPKRQKVM